MNVYWLEIKQSVHFEDTQLHRVERMCEWDLEESNAFILLR